MKTGFQNSIKKVEKIDTHVTRFGVNFGGPFLSKKSVVCRSKMSLTCGPLKIVILAPSGTQKAPNLGSFFHEDLIDFQMMGASSA